MGEIAWQSMFDFLKVALGLPVMQCLMEPPEEGTYMSADRYQEWVDRVDTAYMAFTDLAAVAGIPQARAWMTSPNALLGMAPVVAIRVAVQRDDIFSAVKSAQDDYEIATGKPVAAA